ncbi:hypothetical protein [Janibacter limosus]|jgi:hypothetical protein|uniref:hypothetical protein n=1 Tax=Janibacter limosus TaxID=53458 RepID=UPI000AAA7D81|nr:hypothetical protein [Janibacter limosus]
MTARFTRALVGLAAALSLAACGLGPVMSGSPSPSTSQKDGEIVREDFYTQIGEITEAAGGDWTYLDRTTPFSPDDRDWFNPKACSSDPDSRQLLLMLLSGPTTDGPADIKRMSSLLKARGMEVTNYRPGNTVREGSGINAESAAGFFVSYRTNDLKTTVRFGSECSSHPSMNEQVG